MNALASEDHNIANILILDDSAFDRARLRRAIQVARFRCCIQEVESLQAAEAVLHSDGFDLAVLDYDLPDGTGHDAIRLLQRSPLNSQVSMVMITGNQSARVSRVALEMGCVACISKDGLTPDGVKCVFVDAMKQTRNRAHVSQSCSKSNSHCELFVVN